MTPGDYLRRRRVAAGLSLTDVATMLAPDSSAEPAILALLTAIEADRTPASPEMLTVLRGTFAFDRYAYRFLAAGDLATPQLCRVCACSWCDPCDDELAGPCAWSDDAPDLCTHCAAKLAASRFPQPERHDHEA